MKPGSSVSSAFIVEADWFVDAQPSPAMLMVLPFRPERREAVPAVIELWTYAFVAMLATALVVPQRRRALGRASPADLQRFLF
jgi:hypothetical protein